MVSSDFGKLDVIRHLISGDDCAMAGEATAVAAAPAAETFKKSRRFIQASPCGAFPGFQASSGGRIPRDPGRSRRGHNTEVRLRKRDKGMTALTKPKSHAASRPLQAAAITP